MKQLKKLFSKKHTDLKKECDRLWAEVVKLRAGGRSQISGKREPVMNAHHVVGKPNNRLRYEIDNGICLTPSEHIYGIHNEGRRREYEERIIRAIGRDKYEWLLTLQHECGGTNLVGVRELLKQQLKRMKK